MEKKRNWKKRLKPLIIVTVICAIIWFIVWRGGLDRFIPHTYTWFVNYQSFRLVEHNGFYPDKLPKGVSDKCYYFYEGFFDHNSAVSFVIKDEKDYVDLKNQYEELLRSNESKHINVDNVIYCFDETMENANFRKEEIEILEKKFIKESKGYKVVASERFENCDSISLDGVICNDSKREIIIFDFWDRDPNYEENE